MNYNFLQSIMTRAQLPAEAVEDLLSTAKALPKAVIGAMEEGLALYKKDTFFDFKEQLKKVIDLAPEGLKEASQLIFSFVLTEHTLELYKQAGRSDELFDNMLRDLRVKNEECVRYYGRNGSFVASWFYRWFNLQRVALERLQFEIRELPLPYRHLPAGSKAINVHIPACGPLDHDACLRDYQRIAKIFAEDFKEQDAVFMCDSWLLHPEHPEFLPPKSRLREFQADFEIIRFVPDPEGKDLWRLFGVPYDGNPEHLTERNSLERAYKEYLLKGGVSGEGLGAFIYK